MSVRQGGANKGAYRPTSLDFINRPNPVEPWHAVQEKHPLNVTRHLEGTAGEDLFRRFDHVTKADRPTKRRRSGEPKLLDLPELPAVGNETRRPRLPPTLSGLHQPPPDAGLLPSMSVAKPVKVPETTSQPVAQPVAEPNATQVLTGIAEEPGDSVACTPKPSSNKPRRNKWSDDETARLLKGVAEFGIGNWTKILHCPDYGFKGTSRTALDLKDRFRVCCPDDYKTDRTRRSTMASEKSSKQDRSERKSAAELHKLGITGPFEKSKRRRRTGYTATEDDALLKGFERYGNAWTAIRDDEALELKHRTATDLRDRFRTKHPDKYEKAGLTKKPEDYAKQFQIRTKMDNGIAAIGDADNAKEERAPVPGPDTDALPAKASQPEKEKEEPPAQANPKAQQQSLSFVLPNDDLLWDAIFDTQYADLERPTLDRGILDWPADNSRLMQPNDAAGKGGIDPLVTLNLPKLAAITPAAPGGFMQSGNGVAGFLPPLASVTAGLGGDNFSEQLELPSLMDGFGSLESDGRTTGHFLDDLLT